MIVTSASEIPIKSTSAPMTATSIRISNTERSFGKSVNQEITNQELTALATARQAGESENRYSSLGDCKTILF